ncbi:MAG: hypothetical protein C0504_09355 [Candidatus Solibacter sp.]|nr:hypothetical protein [Candidatus Solibacter sp.]
MKAAKFRDIDRVLRRLGYRHVRTHGSHYMYSKPDSPIVIPVPFKKGDIPAGTVRSILEAAGLSWREFLDMK